ncbi:transcription factor ORG2-like isoform X2 [Rhodamnia argentea]|uniref:Transcription factor ORG2-like isoform X2 n=1 Tax=Rhodamnia argentea TaxID=178133 RepID=A0ABM3GTI2_9MYRT|nr:transcription factor ORG2-like isoform X2 [Rhodamnia argentea]
MIIHLLVDLNISETSRRIGPQMLSFPPSVWPYVDSTSQEQENYMRREAHPCSPPPPLHLPFSSPSPDAELVLEHLDIPFAAMNGEAGVVKKLNHNARERDRRKKINGLYSTLRSLLPSADQTKLSIPATVSRVLKYVPELQQQVQILAQEKEELLSRINAAQGSEDCTHQETGKGKGAIPNSAPSISTNHLSESEVAIQICTTKVATQNTTVDFSEILLNLDYHGFPLINASTFKSFGGTRTTFCNLHVQVERSWGMECEALKEILLALYDQKGREVKFLRQHENLVIM